VKDDCFICGTCWWSKCLEPADFEMDVDVKRNHGIIYSGVVDLCHSHAKYAVSSGGHLNLKWEALEQALTKQSVSGTAA